MYTVELPALRDRARHIADTLSAERPVAKRPTEAEIAHVTAWQTAVADVARIIRELDDIIARTVTLRISEDSDADLVVERDAILTLLRQLRAQAFERMRELNPDQAWFWTEEWQRKEREASDDIAAGRVTRYNSGEDFLAALKARM